MQNAPGIVCPGRFYFFLITDQIINIKPIGKPLNDLFN